MIKTTKTTNGRTVTRYTFSSKDKEILSGYIPLNPCSSCPDKGGCCGCLKHREYLDWMYVHFGEDLELIHFAEQIANLRLRKYKIDLAKRDWEKECVTLPNQIRDYALKKYVVGGK